MRKASFGFDRAALAVAVSFLLFNSAWAQVESLNPNPTLPSGVGGAGELEGYHHGSSAGTQMGRMKGARVDGADKNPADIMLRDIGGTNRGRRTGHAAIRGGAVRAALKVEGAGRGSPFGTQGAVYFGRRGDYENAIYMPQRGSYREPEARGRPAARAGTQR